MKRYLLAAVTAASVFVAAAPAEAAKKFCVGNNHGSYVCFQPSDDVLWVKDTRKDGYAASLYYRTNYGREGECRNNEGKGRLTFCDLDMQEGKTITFWAVNTRIDGSYRFWSVERKTTI